MQSSDKFFVSVSQARVVFGDKYLWRADGEELASYAEREELLAAITHWLNPSAAVNRKGREARPPHFFWSFDSMYSTAMHGFSRSGDHHIFQTTSQVSVLTAVGDEMVVSKRKLLVTLCLEYF